MKAQIREEIIDKLSKFEPHKKNNQTKEISEKFLSSKAFQSANSVALYMNTQIEFDLLAIFKATKKVGKKILIPKTYPKRKMAFIEYDEKNLTKTKFGPLEPVSNVELIPDLILVPGLAWNFEGYRIGYGGGFYDRYLANYKGDTISLVYDFQRLNFFPEVFDIPIKETFSV